MVIYITEALGNEHSLGNHFPTHSLPPLMFKSQEAAMTLHFSDHTIVSPLAVYPNSTLANFRASLHEENTILSS